jgi:hypothetical protein
MISRRIWQAFSQPPMSKPLFERVVLNAAFSPALRSLWWNNLAIQGQVWLWSLVFILDVRALPLMLLSGTFYGALWAVGVSGTILHERSTGTYDLLCLTPEGTFGVNWTICLGCLHQGDAFRHVNSQEAWTIRLMLMIPLIITGNLALNRLLTNSPVALLWMAVLVLLFYLDHIQSIIMGTLFGLMAPQTSAASDTRLWAVAGLILTQVLSYGTFFSVILLSPLLNLPPALSPLIALAAFFSLRDCIIYALIRSTMVLFNASADEMHMALNPLPSVV